MSYFGFEGLALNMATVRGQWGLQKCIDGCLRAGYVGIAPSINDLTSLGTSISARALRNSGLTVTGLNPSQPVVVGTGATRRHFIDGLRTTIDLASMIGACYAVVIGGGLPPGSRDVTSARRHFYDAITEVEPEATAASVRLAVEPLHPTFAADRSVVCDLSNALDMITTIGGAAGILLDTYHVWWDPRLMSLIASAKAGVFVGYHVSDWLHTSEDRLLDRGMIGDGVIDIGAISRGLLAGGYCGFVEIEILSTRWWGEEPERVLALAQSRLATALTVTVNNDD